MRELAAALALTLASAPAQDAAPFGEVGVAGDWLTVDGERFLVVGVGYEVGCRPGQLPWRDRYPEDLLRRDFARIRAAGFNTIRGWTPLTEGEIEIAAGYGLWVIQGNWIDPESDFASPEVQRRACEQVEREVARLAHHPNVLLCLLMNEPHGGAVFRAGASVMEEFLRDLSAAAHRADPHRLVTFANCIYADHLDASMWPVAAHNVYPYSPDTIRRALSYRGQIEQLKETTGRGRPLLITEFGLSVSPSGDGRGYGGNSLEQQRDGDLAMWDDLLSAGAAGGCVFMWIDGWWKHGDENRHDDHAEEWYGLLEADTSPEGTPRPVYHALSDFNRAIRVLPRQSQLVDGEVSIEVWAPEAATVQWRLDEGDWIGMQRDGRWWWRGTADVSALPGGCHELWTRAVSAEGYSEAERRCPVTVVHGGPLNDPPVRVRIVSRPVSLPASQEISVEIEVTGGDGAPLGGRDVRVEQFVQTEWFESGVDVVTDDEGRATATLPGHPRPAILSIAAGTEFGEGPCRRRTGDLIHVELTRPER